MISSIALRDTKITQIKTGLGQEVVVERDDRVQHRCTDGTRDQRDGETNLEMAKEIHVDRGIQPIGLLGHNNVRYTHRKQ